MVQLDISIGFAHTCTLLSWWACSTPCAEAEKICDLGFLFCASEESPPHVYVYFHL